MTDTLTPIFGLYVPPRKEMERGKIYISKEYHSSSHLCPCGCDKLVVLPLEHTAGSVISRWEMTEEQDGTVSFEPSIGNYQYECQSHYHIKHNKIIWA